MAKAIYNGKSNDIKSIYDSNFDFSINAGISFNVFDNFELGLRYNRGFISTIENLRFFDQYGIDKGRAILCNQGVTVTIIYLMK